MTCTGILLAGLGELGWGTYVVAFGSTAMDVGADALLAEDMSAL
jgi:hypothetical protein